MIFLENIDVILKRLLASLTKTGLVGKLRKESFDSNFISQMRPIRAYNVGKDIEITW